MTEHEKLVEMLAALEHEQWAHWTRYMLEHLTPEDVERWRRQCEKPYSALSEREKRSDRRWAKNTLNAINASGIAWVAPWVPTEAMMLEFAHGLHEQWGDYIAMRDAHLAEEMDKNK